MAQIGMKILALETSSTACSVALQIDNKCFSQHQIAPMQQAKTLLPMIQSLLEEANLSLTQLDAIAYGCGPGSFTGIRIANSVAQGLAFAANLPVVPVSSLAILAQTAWEAHQCRHALVAIDGRMEQVYWAEYTVNESGLAILIGEECACRPNQIPTHAFQSDAYGIGDGWLKYYQEIEKSIKYHPVEVYPNLIPTAKALLPLARAKFEQGGSVTASQALPVYLR